jgi:hypothetical protein
VRRSTLRRSGALSVGELRALLGRSELSGRAPSSAGAAPRCRGAGRRACRRAAPSRSSRRRRRRRSPPEVAMRRLFSPALQAQQPELIGQRRARFIAVHPETVHAARAALAALELRTQARDVQVCMWRCWSANRTRRPHRRWRASWRSSCRRHASRSLRARAAVAGAAAGPGYPPRLRRRVSGTPHQR